MPLTRLYVECLLPNAGGFPDPQAAPRQHPARGVQAPAVAVLHGRGAQGGVRTAQICGNCAAGIPDARRVGLGRLREIEAGLQLRSIALAVRISGVSCCNVRVRGSGLVLGSTLGLRIRIGRRGGSQFLQSDSDFNLSLGVSYLTTILALFLLIFYYHSLYTLQLTIFHN